MTYSFTPFPPVSARDALSGLDMPALRRLANPRMGFFAPRTSRAARLLLFLRRNQDDPRSVIG